MSTTCTSPTTAPDTEEPRVPAGEHLAAASDSNVGSPIANFFRGLFNPQPVPSTQQSRQARRQEYYKRPDALYPQYFKKPPGAGSDPRQQGHPFNAKFGPITPENRNDCRGVAYTQLENTIGQCGCRILDACARTQGSRRAGPSCHQYGAAVDVMKVSCDGETQHPVMVPKYKNGSMKPQSRWDAWDKWGNDRYFQFADCMNDKKFFPHRIWQQQDHFDHAHFSYDCKVYREAHWRNTKRGPVWIPAGWEGHW